MPAPAPIPPELTAGPFRVGDSGLTRGRLRSSDLVSPVRGTRVVASAAPTLLRDCHAWALRMPPRSFFCGPTAAALHGIPLPVGLTPRTPIHVGVAAGARRFDAAGIAAHQMRLNRLDLCLLDGLAVTTPERTWCDLAGVLSLPALVAAGDFLVWRRHPITTIDRLSDAVLRHQGRRGLRVLRAAVQLLSDRSDSPPESELRIAILGAGLPLPAINQPIRDARGRFIAQPDQSWPDYRTALEYEGDHHRTEKAQWYEDMRRVNDLQLSGWSVFRAGALDYARPDALLQRLAAAFALAGWDGRRIRHW